MIRLLLRGDTEIGTRHFADHVAVRLRDALEKHESLGRLLGPTAAPLAKLRGKYRFHMMVLGPDLTKLRRAVRDAVEDLKMPGDLQSIVDVDPLDML